MAATKSVYPIGYTPGWQLRVNGELVTGQWTLESRFGSVRQALVCNIDGTPNFDRPAYREAENVNCVVWGRGEHGEIRLAVIRQPRPHADDPCNRGVDGHDPVVFGQVVMGFLEKVIGKDGIARLESVSGGAIREASEEAGASAVLGIEYPNDPFHNPSPSFVATWSDLVYIQVDLKKIENLKHDRNEPIYSAEYVTVAELVSRIKNGHDAMGAYYRYGNSNSAWLIFLCDKGLIIT